MNLTGCTCNILCKKTTTTTNKKTTGICIWMLIAMSAICPHVERAIVTRRHIILILYFCPSPSSVQICGERHNKTHLFY